MLTKGKECKIRFLTQLFASISAERVKLAIVLFILNYIFMMFIFFYFFYFLFFIFYFFFRFQFIRAPPINRTAHSTHQTRKEKLDADNFIY